MNIILLSGGSGKRLWPLSNDVRSKQFIKIFKDEDCGYESMLQRVYRQIKTIDKSANVTIATSRSQVSSIRNQIGCDVGISIEPCRRDTFAAIVLATVYLVDVLNINPSEVVVVCPVDPYVGDNYFEKIRHISTEAEKGTSSIVLMGIEPTYPSEKYGYIIPETRDDISKVREFKEKPTEAIAREYIQQGALWNGGVFAYKLEYMLNKAHELIDFVGYQDLYGKYESLPRISFDYAVVEKEKSIEVVKFCGEWKDIGTWNTFAETMSENVIGKAIVGDECIGVSIINEMDVPILAMGLKDVIISASPDGILVSSKNQSSHIKKYVDKFDRQAMYMEKSWGSFKVLDVEKESMTIKVSLNPGHCMNYHSHKYRDEVWVVISGEGETIVDGAVRKVKAGDVITVPAGAIHTIISKSGIKLIEEQIGENIRLEDKELHELTSNSIYL